MKTKKQIFPIPARLIIWGILGATAASFLFAGGVELIREAEPSGIQSGSPPLIVQTIEKNLYLVKGGSGANTAFYVTEKEVFVIDAKMSPESAVQMLAEIGKITEAPPKTVILTHSDGDHINGLPGFPKELSIIAHENCKADVEAAAGSNPALKEYVPNKTYADNMLSFYKAEDGWIDLLHFGPAHTNGDTIVWFPREKAVFVGDLIFIGRDPLIHRHKNGNSFGYVKTLKNMMKLSPRVEIFLSGHADPQSREDIESLISVIEEKQEKVKAMVEAGRSLEEVKKAFGIEEQPAQQGRRRWPSFVETVYLELTGK